MNLNSTNTTNKNLGFQSSSGVGILAYSQINYIPAGDGLAAIYVKKNSEAGNYYYTYKDHLGPLLTLTDDEGEVVFEQNFDAWEDGALKKCTVYIFSERASLQGRLRNADTWAYSNSSSTDFAWLNRGYTGHEMLPHFGLVNMNNRLYDPLLGRFLAVDNYVQDPFSSQGYNRFSYCFNNPLKYTDPDGEWVHLAVGAVIGGTINWLANGAQWNAKGLGYFGVGALAGALSAGIGAGVNVAMAGGSFGAGFIGTSAVTRVMTGFASGFVTGASSGFTSGFISGTGNSIVGGQKIGSVLNNGVNQAWKQGLVGGVIGGVVGGLDAVNNDRNFWTGAKRQDLVVKVPTHGNANVKALNDDIRGKSSIISDFDTKIIESDNISVTTNADGDFVTTIKVDGPDIHKIDGLIIEPKEVVLKSSINGNTIKVTSIERLQTAKIFGYRYYSTPLSSIRDLFHARNLLP